MRRIVLQYFTLVVLLIPVGSTALLQAQEITPLMLVERHLAALGDSTTLFNVMVCELQGRLIIERLVNEREYLFTKVTTSDWKYFFDLSNSLGGVLYKEAFDGSRGWYFDKGEVGSLEGGRLAVAMNQWSISPFLDTFYYRGQLIGVKERKSGYTLSAKDSNGEIHSYTFDKRSYVLTDQVYRDDLGILNMVSYQEHSLHHGLLLPTTIKWTRYLDYEGKPQKEVRVFSIETVNLLFEQQGDDLRLKVPD